MPLPADAKVEPFEVHIEDEVLTDLQERLRNTRFAEDPNNEDWYYGPPAAYMKELADYWLNDFDWRAAEDRINAYDHYIADVDGAPVHFMYKEGVGPSPVPLILAHGWPWTFWFYNRLIDPLADPGAHGGDPADAFDAIIPSLPNFTFSRPQPDLTMNFWKMADVLDQMMRENLGHERYAVAGSDYGTLVAEQLGHKYADHLYGIHLGHDIPLDLFQSERAWDLTGGQMVPEGIPDELRAEILEFAQHYASHVAVHLLDAQTLTNGINDSPVGMLSWIIRRWHDWSDIRPGFENVWSRDEILTNATLWWATETAGSSIRLYSNCNRYPWKPSHDRKPVVEAPTGFMLPGGDIYPPGASDAESRMQVFREGPTAEWFNTVLLEGCDEGGHFAPFENPDAFVGGIQRHFRALR